MTIPSLYGEWAAEARKTLEASLPGSSQAVRVLRENIGAAARSASPVMLCGRPGSGRMFLAGLIAALRPAGESAVKIFQATAAADAALRTELFGPDREAADATLAERARGSMVVVRDVHLMSQALQRELTAAVTEDLESGYGPAVR